MTIKRNNTRNTVGLTLVEAYTNTMKYSGHVYCTLFTHTKEPEGLINNSTVSDQGYCIPHLYVTIAILVCPTRKT